MRFFKWWLTATVLMGARQIGQTFLLTFMWWCTHDEQNVCPHGKNMVGFLVLPTIFS